MSFPELRGDGGRVARPRFQTGFVTDIDIRQPLRTLWRRRWVIMALVLAAMASSWLFAARIEPIYTATSQVMIDSRRTRIIDIKEILSQLSPQVVTVTSEVEVLRSRGIAKRVADSLNLYQNPEFNPALRPIQATRFGLAAVREALAMVTGALGIAQPPRPSEDPAVVEERMRAAVIDTLMARLEVSAVPQSMVMRISFQSTSAETASRIANAFAESYVTDQLEAKFQALRYASTWLNERLDGLRKAVVSSEQAVSGYRAEQNLLESRGASAAQQKLTELNTQLVVIQSKRAESEARLARVEAMTRSGRGADALDEVLDSQLVMRLKEQEATLSREASDLASRYGARHPQISKVQAELGELRGRIASEVGKLGQGLRNDAGVLKDRERAIVAQIKELESVSLRQGNEEIRLRELEREAQANRMLYETFLNRFKETDQQESIQQPDARIISLSETPRRPSYPRIPTLVFGATALGLLGAVILVLLIEKFDNTTRTKDQLESATGLPVLGLIPQVRARIARSDVSSYLIDRPGSSYAESFRIVWFAIRHPPDRPEPKTIVVTSSIPDEGKSLTALSLARTAASLGLRAILIDADLRRPSIAQKMGVTPDKTLADVLANDATIEQAILRDPISGMDVLAGRPSKQKQIDLLGAADRLRAVIAELRADYDVVVIDSPPALPVADVQILARIADATIFCVRWNATPRESIQGAVQTLLDAKANLVGTLLTRVNVRKHSSYGYRDIGYYYGRYRSYYTD